MAKGASCSFYDASAAVVALASLLALTRNGSIVLQDVWHLKFNIVLSTLSCQSRAVGLVHTSQTLELTFITPAQ